MNDFGTQLSEILDEFKTEVIEAVNDAAEETAKDTRDYLKTAGSFQDRSGKYRRSWTYKKEPMMLGRVKYVVHAKKPHYRLAHLLEHGHALKGGGRARAFPHIEDAEKRAQEVFERNTIAKL